MACPLWHKAGTKRTHRAKCAAYRTISSIEAEQFNSAAEPALALRMTLEKLAELFYAGFEVRCQPLQ